MTPLILTVDSNIDDLNKELQIIKNILPEAVTVGFETYEEALRFAGKADCDLLFTDTELKDGSGMELAEEIKKVCPEVQIVFVTEHEEHAAKAFRLHAEGFIVKPLTEEMLKEEIENLTERAGKDRAREISARQRRPELRIQTFGNFECFVDDKPVTFKYFKSKELLAYLVDRKGAMCTNGELISILWGEDSANKDSYFRNIKADLIGALRKKGVEDAIIKQKGAMGLNTDRVKCDYYDMLNGDKAIEGSYMGEYISQYSWAEVTHAFLSHYYNVRHKNRADMPEH